MSWKHKICFLGGFTSAVLIVIVTQIAFVLLWDVGKVCCYLSRYQINVICLFLWLSDLASQWGPSDADYRWWFSTAVMPLMQTCLFSVIECCCYGALNEECHCGCFGFCWFTFIITAKHWTQNSVFYKTAKIILLVCVGKGQGPSKPPKDWSSKVSTKNSLHMPVAFSWLILAEVERREYNLLVGGENSNSACKAETGYMCTIDSNYWDNLSASEA